MLRLELPESLLHLPLLLLLPHPLERRRAPLLRALPVFLLLLLQVL